VLQSKTSEFFGAFLKIPLIKNNLPPSSVHTEIECWEFGSIVTNLLACLANSLI
jgi:hypothetical protein